MSTVTARVFKGCRALLAPAKSASASSATKPTTTTTTTTTTKTTPKPKPKAKAKAKAKATSPSSVTRTFGIMKAFPVSPVLGDFCGTSEVSRADAVKQIWAYIKSNNLQNPTNKREIFCDHKLKTIFDGKDKVGFLEIGKLLSRHFVKTG